MGAATVAVCARSLGLGPGLQQRGEAREGEGAVAVLAAFRGHADGEASGSVHDTDRARAGVDMLAPGSARAIEAQLEIIGVEAMRSRPEGVEITRGCGDEREPMQADADEPSLALPLTPSTLALAHPRHDQLVSPEQAAEDFAGFDGELEGHGAGRERFTELDARPRLERARPTQASERFSERGDKDTRFSRPCSSADLDQDRIL